VVLTKKRIVIQNLEKLEFEFSAQLSKLQSDAQTQKDEMLQQLAEVSHFRAFPDGSSAKNARATEQFNY